MSTTRQKRFEDTPGFPLTMIVFEIDHADVIKNDTLLFREFWDIDRIARAGKLHEAFGKTTFCVGGFDSDERVLHEIPEVRRHLRTLASQWPYFFYADALDDGFLLTLLLCLVPDQVTIRRDSDLENYSTQILPADMNKACEPLFAGLWRACSLDHTMSQPAVEQRTQAVAAHLQKLVA